VQRASALLRAKGGNETFDSGENLCLIGAPRDFRDQFQRSGCLGCGDSGIALYAQLWMFRLPVLER
jgi:hypothetical protein